MKAREFLARKKRQVEERNLIKQPLTGPEIRALAKKAGGVELLVAPKRRAEADGLSGEKLIAWLAEDGARVRRPIIERRRRADAGLRGRCTGEARTATPMSNGIRRPRRPANGTSSRAPARCCHPTTRSRAGCTGRFGDAHFATCAWAGTTIARTWKTAVG